MRFVYRVLCDIQDGAEAPTAGAIQGALEVGMDGAPDEMAFSAIDAITVEAPVLDEQQFMVQWENAARAEFCTLDDIVQANAEGDPELCEWARTAEVGDSHITGGGAAPAVTTWRIA